MAVVLDTSFLWGAFDEDDHHHHRAGPLFERLARGRQGALVTNDGVYAEATAIAARSGHPAEDVPRLDKFFFGPDSPLEVHRLDQRAFAQARDRLLASPGRGLSLVDWSLVVLAERTRAAGVATYDARLGGMAKAWLR